MRLWEERRKAYSTMARVTKVVHTSDQALEDYSMAEAHAEIELLTDNPELVAVAGQVIKAMAKAQDTVRHIEHLGAVNPFRDSLYQLQKQALDQCSTNT